MSLYSDLLTTIRSEIPGVTTRVDNSNSGHYVILKLGKRTIGYINGKEKFRIDSPKLDSKVLITHSLQIPVAVEFLQQYAREDA